MTTTGKNYDVLVIGSGATGSIAVKELTERGLDVLLLEAERGHSRPACPGAPGILQP